MSETKKKCVDSAIKSMHYAAHPQRSPHADNLEVYLKTGAFDEPNQALEEVTQEMEDAGAAAGRAYMARNGGNSPAAIYRAMREVALNQPISKHAHQKHGPVVLITKVKLGGHVEGMLSKGVDAKSIVGARLYTGAPPAQPAGGDAKLAELQADLLCLQKFMVSVMGEFPERADIDGFALQGKAQLCGLIEPAKVRVPCGLHCGCAEAGVIGGKAIQCFLVQPVMRRAREAASRDQTNQPASHKAKK